MRISDWSSDVCSSDLGGQAKLRDRLASLPGPLPRPARIPSHALPPPEDRQQPVPPVAAPPALAAPAFLLPALGDVTTGFGELSPAGVRSRGLTLRTREKAQVIAPAGGRVAFAGPFRDYEIGRASCRDRGCQYG